jgi:hexosaminidase
MPLPAHDTADQIPAPPSAPSHPSLGVVATLRAKTVYGALRGLESFSQLVALDWPHRHQAQQQQQQQAGGRLRPAHNRYLLPAGAPLVIADRPRFPWRGLLIDTGRHFLPVPHIKVRRKEDGGRRRKRR